MPRLLIVYDPMDRIHPMPADFHMGSTSEARPREAMLSLEHGTEGKDIYNIARKLAELLLEQL